jgi:poly-gamma-glutamate capsule biosynthesis protein CapA/YwtB (metallophosphatase superfamily)
VTRGGERLRAALVVGALVVLLSSPGGERVTPVQAAGAHAAGAPAAAEQGGPAPAPATTTSTTPPPPRTFTLVATGDVLLHSGLWAQAQADAAAEGRPGRDFAPLIAGVRPIVEGADLAICHLETPIGPPEGPFSGYPIFSVPPEIVPALAATGYDACTTASNHTYDKGAEGVDRTLNALDAGGLAHAGSARTPQEAAAITVVDAGPARVALLSYTFGFNGIPAPGGEAWRSNIVDEGRILADAARARAGGADVVVVALHWGNEYAADPNAQQADLAPRLIASDDIDLLLGHHAHVVQPLQQVGGEWVVYGMGNLVATHSTPGSANHEGLLVRFTFTETGDAWRVTAAEYAPLLMVTDGAKRVLDVNGTLAAGSAPALTDRLVLARDRTTGVVGSRGAFEAGLRPIAA